MKNRRTVLAALILTLSAGVLYLFLDFIRDDGAINASINRADAIVVLTGGKGRIERGVELYKEGAAGLLILSGVDADATLDSIFFNTTIVIPPGDIFLDKNSRSTYQNAIEVRKILESRGFRSMILITSAYHMKRAHYIFRRIMPGDVRIESLRVKSPNFDEKRWWTNPAIVIKEFLKYQWYVLRFGVEDVLA